MSVLQGSELDYLLELSSDWPPPPHGEIEAKKGEIAYGTDLKPAQRESGESQPLILKLRTWAVPFASI